jgi:hypothetical protein
LASQEYISIVRLLQHCDVDIDAPLQLARVRKQVSAEFASSADGFVDVEGWSYNKSDVLQEIDEPDFLVRWQFHLIIWRNPQLLQLLEEEYVNMDTIDAELAPHKNNEGFIAFFSPYFKDVFNSLCKSLLNPPNIDVLGQFLRMQNYLLPMHYEDAFKSVSKFLTEQDKILRNTTSENYRLQRNDLAFWRDNNWHLLLNNLPESMYEVKEDFVVHLINLTVATQKINKSDCIKYSEKMIRLYNIDPEHRNIIVGNHNVFHGNAGRAESEQSYWWVLWLAIALIRFVSHC